MGASNLKLIVLSTVLLIVLAAIAAFAAETKVEGRIYDTWMLNTSAAANDYNTFSLDRSYVTAKSKLSDYTDVIITMDLRSTTGYSGYTMVLKYGYAAWKPKFVANFLTVSLGLQPIRYPEAADTYLWGRRYLLQSTGDLNSFLTTSDLGITLNSNIGKNGKYGYAGVAVLNGTKYTDVTEKNKEKDINPYVIFKPLPNDSNFAQTVLAAQFYSGTQNIGFGDTLSSSDYKRRLISLGGKLAYKQIFSVGGDLNWNTLGQGAGNEDLKQSALSGFGTLYLASLAGPKSILRTLDIFGRVDFYDPNTNVDNDRQTLLVGGVECVPIKGVAASVNLRHTSYQASNKTAQSSVFFNSEFRF